MKNIIIEPLIVIFVLISYKIFILGECAGYKYIGWLLLLIIIVTYIMLSAKARKKKIKYTKNKIRSADELTVSVSFGMFGFLYILTEEIDAIGNIVIGCIIGLSLIRAILYMYFGTDDESEKTND